MSKATNVRIETDRLLIVSFSKGFLTERYIQWLNDPVLMRFSDQRYKVHTRKSCLKYLESFTGTPNLFLAILVKDQDLWHIGNMTIYADQNHRVADIGILIGEQNAQGKGYATEAWKAVCEYLFRDRSIRKVTAGTLELNKAMLRLMEKTGMVPDGRRIRQCLWNGQEVDIVHAALFNDMPPQQKQ